MILFIGITLFILALMIHIVIWKIKVPERQKTALLATFVAVLVSGLTGIKLGNYFYPAQFFWTPTNLVEYLHIGLFFLSLLFFYVSVYTAVEADSPSLKSMVRVYEAGETGVTLDKLVLHFNGERFLRSRLHHLIKDGMLFHDGQYYTLTTTGTNFLRICFYWRKILGMTGDVG
jgi:hypothetical protein